VDEALLVEHVRGWLSRAIIATRREERALWELKGGERAVVAQVYRRLQFDAFPTWDIDLEYLREGPGGVRKSGPEPRSFGIPDLVVHRRGELDSTGNLLVVEFKIEQTVLRAQSYDRRKIGYWQARFGYALGAVVSLGSAADSIARWSWRPRHGVWSATSDLEEPESS